MTLIRHLSYCHVHNQILVSGWVGKQFFFLPLHIICPVSSASCEQEQEEEEEEGR